MDDGSPSAVHRRRDGPSIRTFLALGVVLVGCTSGSSGDCVRPPASAVVNSPVSVVVRPNPVTAGSIVELSVGLGVGVAEGDIVGAAAEWQCWDGNGWRVTHQVVRGFSGDPVTLAVEPGSVTTVPAVGLPIPSRYPILIPMVDPGVYRIWEEVMSDEAKYQAYEFIEVVAES